MLKWIGKFLGGISVGLGLLLVIMLLLFSSFNEQLHNSENVLNETFDKFILENGEELVDMMVGDQFEGEEYELLAEQCKEGLVSDNCGFILAFEENKTALLDMPIFQQQKSVMVGELNEQLDSLVGGFDFLDEGKYWLYAIILIVVGTLLLFFGVGFDWKRLVTRLGWIVFWKFLFFGIVLFYFSKISADTFLSGFGGFLGMTGIFLKLFVEVILAFLVPVAETYYLLFLIIALLGLLVALSFAIIRFVVWVKNKF